VNKENWQNTSDEELLAYYYHHKNNEWLGILLQRYTLLLLGTCMKYLKNEEEAKDAVQQIFLKVLAEAHKYKIDFFKSWLYMVARNHCLMKLREKKALVTEEHIYHIPAAESVREDLLEKEQLLDLMKECY
jgi:RNA polymerase sigma factor (sigma-70 family)